MRPGLIRDFPGSLADYRAYVEQGLWGITEDGSGKKDGSPENAERVKEERIREREQRKKRQRAVEKLEREISARETDIGRLKAALNDPASASNHQLLAETSQTIRMEQAELDDLLREWERLRRELEEMSNN
jgi:hypothetical protein